MDIGNIAQLVSSVGFPIAACCAMAWYCVKTKDDITAMNTAHYNEVKELNKQHADDISKMTEAINNNTVALQRLSVMLGEEPHE